jgi:hypothetical protein
MLIMGFMPASLAFILQPQLKRAEEGEILAQQGLLMQRDLPLSNADGGSVLEYNLVIEDY